MKAVRLITAKIITNGTTKYRLGRTLAAQVYSQVVTIACQLALVPLLLAVWGTQRYGSWLVLSAIPTFLTFSDFGFTFVAKNEMIIAVAAGQKPRAVATFQSIFVMLNLLVPIVFGLSCAYIFIAQTGKATILPAFFSVSELKAIPILIANVLIYQYFLLICAGIRAENRPATETIWAATSRLAESVIYGTVAIVTDDFAIVAGAGLISRIVFLLGAYRSMRKISPWLSFGTAAASFTEIRRLAHPAIAYMLVPIGQALLLQAPVIMLGKLMGPIAVVSFSTMRTIARVGTAGINMINNTFIAEYSSAAGAGDAKKFRRLRLLQFRLVVVVIIAYLLIVFTSGPFILQIFTHGKVKLLNPLFNIILASVAFEMIWSTQFTPISSINRHRLVTYALATLAGLGLVAMYFIIPERGPSGAAAVICGIHILMVGVCACIAWQIERQGIKYG